MATARISESFWTCTKRWETEIWIQKAGHKWPSPRSRQPMSAAECIGRILAWMDARCIPSGSLEDVDVAAVEFAAGWSGDEGLLVQALVENGWIEQRATGMFWHDYGSFNGITLRDRLKKRGKRPGTGQGFRSDKVGDKQRDEVGDKVVDEVGASGSGSGSGSGYGPSPVSDSSQTRNPHSPRTGSHPLADAWNETAGAEGLPKVTSVSAARKRHAENRLREADLDTWKAAFRLIAHDPFCRGQNDRGWKADFDYAIRPEKSGKWLDAARTGSTNGKRSATYDPDYEALLKKHLEKTQ